jgi:hypothetical protein
MASCPKPTHTPPLFLLPPPLPLHQSSPTLSHKRQAQAPHHLIPTGTPKNGVVTKLHRRLPWTLQAYPLSSPSAESALTLSISQQHAESSHRKDYLPYAQSFWRHWSSGKILGDRPRLSTNGLHPSWYDSRIERSTSSIASSIPLLRW